MGNFAKHTTMDKIEFIKAIKTAVENTSADDLKSLLEKPPGRSPNKELLRLSGWYKSLNTLDKENLHKVIKLAVENSIFGMLCVIDGVRHVENTSEKGEFVLEFHKNGNVVRLNDKNDEYLHDLFNAE